MPLFFVSVATEARCNGHDSNDHPQRQAMEERGATVEFEGELAKKGAGLLDRWQDR